MVTPKLKNVIEEPLSLENETIQQIADVLEQASCGPRNRESKADKWCYRITLAGVREYFSNISKTVRRALQ